MVSRYNIGYNLCNEYHSNALIRIKNVRDHSKRQFCRIASDYNILETVMLIIAKQKFKTQFDGNVYYYVDNHALS